MFTLCGKKIMRRFKKEQGGYIFLLVLLFLAVGALLIVPLLGLMGTGTSSGRVYEKRADELYATDAGIEDATWQINEGGMSVFPTYGQYDYYEYSSSYKWDYDLADPVNNHSVHVSIDNEWIPMGISAPSPSQASAIAAGSLAVTGSVSSPGTYRIRISYTKKEMADKGEVPISKIGVWLPAGFEYVAGSSNLEVDQHAAYYKVPVVTSPYKGGEAVIWNFGSLLLTSFPGVQPSDQPMVTEVTFQYTGAEGSSPSAVSWVKTGSYPYLSYPYSWDTETQVYGVVASAGGTGVDAYVAKSTPVSTSGGDFLFDNAITSLTGDVTMSGAAMVISDPRSDKSASVFAAGTLNASSGSPKIEGDVYADTNVNLASSAIIDGNATTPGTINRPGNVTGTATTGASHESPPRLSDSELNSITQGVYASTYNISTPTPSGTPVASLQVKNQGTQANPYHYTGPVNVTGALSFSGVNYVVFDQQVTCGGDMVFQSGNQYVTFSGGVRVTGDMYVNKGSGTINFNNTLTAGSISSLGSYVFHFNDAVKVLGLFKITNGATVSLGSSLYVGGDFSILGAGTLTLNNDIYIGGNLTLSNGAELDGPRKVVVMGGTTQLSGGTQLSAAELPFIVAPNALTFSLVGGATASAVIYAPVAGVSSSGGTSLYGAVIGSRVTLANSGTIIYPTSLNDRTDLPGGGDDGGSSGPTTTTVVSWNIDQ